MAYVYLPDHSRNIKRISYDPITRQLDVTFHARPRVYSHAEVPEKVVNEMIRWPSIGQYYHRVIAKHYKLLDPKEA